MSLKPCIHRVELSSDHLICKSPNYAGTPFEVEPSLCERCLLREPPKAGLKPSPIPVDEPAPVEEPANVQKIAMMRSIYPFPLPPGVAPPMPVQQPRLSTPAQRGPCKHLGVATGELSPCLPCGQKTKLKVFECHSPTRGKPTCTLADCPVCSHHEATEIPVSVKPAAPHRGMSLAELEAICLGPVREWPCEWWDWPVTLAVHRKMLDDAVRDAKPYPGGFKGRGIVMGAGGDKYFSCAWIALYVLRKLGCMLPVQFWYLGPEEMDDRKRALAARLGAGTVDARGLNERLPEKHRRLNGFEVKAFALLHCPFREVLWLDADNIVLRDPTFLFDEPRYQETGAVFFPDLNPYYRREWITKRAWEAAGLQPCECRPFESGQLLIDKEQCWRELQVANHINEHSEFWYGKPGCPDVIYGDKDSFYLAWHRCGHHVQGK